MDSGKGGAGKRRQQRDRERAAYLKAVGQERTICRCAQCYSIISCEGRISRYRHLCRG